LGGSAWGKRKDWWETLSCSGLLCLMEYMTKDQWPKTNEIKHICEGRNGIILYIVLPVKERMSLTGEWHSTHTLVIQHPLLPNFTPFPHHTHTHTHTHIFLCFYSSQAILSTESQNKLLVAVGQLSVLMFSLPTRITFAFSQHRRFFSFFQRSDWGPHPLEGHIGLRLLEWHQSMLPTNPFC
jgi:hypothetical protein